MGVAAIGKECKPAPSVDEALVRLREIVERVREKDTDIEASLDLLEEGIELANFCTEEIDRGTWPEQALEETDGEA